MTGIFRSFTMRRATGEVPTTTTATASLENNVLSMRLCRDGVCKSEVADLATLVKGLGSASQPLTARLASLAKRCPTVRRRRTRRSTARSSTARRSTARRSAARRSAARRSTARRSTARRSTARRSTARRSTARRSAARESTT